MKNNVLCTDVYLYFYMCVCREEGQGRMGGEGGMGIHLKGFNFNFR